LMAFAGTGRGDRRVPRAPVKDAARLICQSLLGSLALNISLWKRWRWRRSKRR
jgi:hypothetical protein